MSSIAKLSLSDKCAACGKGGDGLKTCTACKSVKYCNRACQQLHRKEHKKACKKRAAELHDEKLFAPPPPRDDCPICFIRLPRDDDTRWMVCCGKRICNGCVCAISSEAARKGLENGKLSLYCPFCRDVSSADEKSLYSLQKQNRNRKREEFELTLKRMEA